LICPVETVESQRL